MGDRAPSAHTDLVVFENVRGGRGVRIATSDPDYVCVVTFCAHRQLHCNVVPDSLRLPCVPGRLLLRLVPHCLRTIDRFCSAMVENPERWKRAWPRLDLMLWLKVVGKVGALKFCACQMDIGGPMVKCSGHNAQPCRWFGGWWHQTCVATKADGVSYDDIVMERTSAAWADADWICPLCRSDKAVIG